MHLLIHSAHGDRALVGYLTDEPEFQFELEEDEHYDREAVVEVIEDSAEWMIRVAGGEQPEGAVCGPEEKVIMSDHDRLMRLATVLPKEFDVKVKRADTTPT